MGMFVRRSHYFIIMKRKLTKAFQKLCLREFKIGLNYGTNYCGGLEQDFDVRVKS